MSSGARAMCRAREGRRLGEVCAWPTWSCLLATTLLLGPAAGSIQMLPSPQLAECCPPLLWLQDAHIACPPRTSPTA
jgi:hypothetical protein